MVHVMAGLNDYGNMLATTLFTASLKLKPQLHFTTIVIFQLRMNCALNGMFVLFQNSHMMKTKYDSSWDINSLEILLGK